MDNMRNNTFNLAYKMYFCNNFKRWRSLFASLNILLLTGCVVLLQNFRKHDCCFLKKDKPKYHFVSVNFDNFHN